MSKDLTKQDYEKLGAGFCAQLLEYSHARIKTMQEHIEILQQHVDLLQERNKRLESLSGYQYVTSSTEINTNNHEQE